MNYKSKLAFAVALVISAGAVIAGLAQPQTATASSTMNHDAMQVMAGDLTISNATARFVIAGRPGAVFLTIDNKGAGDRLVSASSPLSDRVELHTHLMEGDVMKMRQIEAIDVAVSGKTELKSGGLHIMMFGVETLPEKGAMVPLTLNFEKAGRVNIKAIVGEPGKAHSH